MANVVASRRETIGDRIRRARAVSGVSATALSLQAGLSRGHVSLLESRRGRVDAQTAWTLAELLGVSPQWLITGKGEAPPALVRAHIRRRASG